jgi:hypothetical protein
MIAWALIITFYPFGVVTIPNIASAEECDRLGVSIEDSTKANVATNQPVQHICLSYTAAPVAPATAPPAL